MTNHINCHQFADSLSDYLEGSATLNARSAIDAHALACAECGPLLADLRKLRVDAANLPELAPGRDLWSGIAARIETPVVKLKNGETSERVTGGAWPMRRVWMGLAAAGLVGITATVTYEVTKRSIVVATPVQQVATKLATKPDSAPSAVQSTTPATVPSRQAASIDSAPPVQRSTVPTISVPTSTVRLASSKPSVEQTYDHEIARLRLIVNRRRSSLDSSTVAVIEYNLKVIDDAIAQCKQALKKDPASRFLIESLNDALDTKIQLLRTAAMLPSRT